MATTSDTIKRDRKALKLSQQRLATLAGVSSKTIQRLESGDPYELSRMTRDTIARIQRALAAERRRQELLR